MFWAIPFVVVGGAVMGIMVASTCCKADGIHYITDNRADKVATRSRPDVTADDSALDGKLETVREDKKDE